MLTSLERAVAEVDPTEVVSLLDALESPGEAAYSPDARQRFARLSAELAWLRRHGEEPVLDLTRRVITTLGLDVEVMATPEFVRTSRRDQLGAFLDAVAATSMSTGTPRCPACSDICRLRASRVRDSSRPFPPTGRQSSCSLFTRPRVWNGRPSSCPALMKGVFPSDRVTDNWVLNPAVLPADLRGDAGSIPQLAETTYAAMAEYKQQLTPPAALGRGQAWLRGGRPEPSGCSLAPATPGGLISATRDRPRATFGRSSRKRCGRISWSPRLRRQASTTLW